MILIFYRHIVSNVGRVAARDSSRAIANGQDLFVAVCEDSSIYGLFKNMTGECGPRHCRVIFLVDVSFYFYLASLWAN